MIMNGKQFTRKLVWLKGRLILHGIGFIVMYFLIRDNIIIGDPEAFSSFSDFGWVQIWCIVQMIFWPFSLLVESISMRILTDVWKNIKFLQNRKLVKSMIVMYVPVVLITIFSTVDCYLSPEDHYLFAESTTSHSSNLTFTLYCVESGLFTAIFIISILAYKHKLKEIHRQIVGELYQHLLQEGINNDLSDQQDAIVIRPQAPPRRAGAPAAAAGGAVPPAPQIPQIQQLQQIEAEQLRREREDNQRFRMSLSILDTDAQKLYNKECPICLGEFEGEDHLIELPCLHSYHSECLRQCTASQRERNCPFCRKVF